jgi:hypothetical protein
MIDAKTSAIVLRRLGYGRPTSRPPGSTSATSSFMLGWHTHTHIQGVWAAKELEPREDRLLIRDGGQSGTESRPARQLLPLQVLVAALHVPLCSPLVR